MIKKEHYINILKDAFIKYWDQKALTDFSSGFSYTHEDICRTIAKNHIIMDKLGIGGEDKCAVMGRNTANWAVSYLSVVTNGTIVVPILDDFNPIDIQNILNHSETVMLFCDAELWKKINPKELNSVKYVISLEDFTPIYYNPSINSPSQEEFESLFDTINFLFEEKYPNGFNKESVQYRLREDDEMISLNYTSGTTSLTKGVMLSSHNMASNILYIPLELGSRGLVVNRTICVLPMAHAFGLAFGFLGPLIYGAEIYFLGKVPSPQIMLSACQQVKPELLLLVPLILEKIFKYNVVPIFNKKIFKIMHEIGFLDKIMHRVIVKKIERLLGGNLKEVAIGGATFNAYIEKFFTKGGFPFTVGYGMTECGPLISYIRHEEFIPTSVGKIVDSKSMSVRIAKEHKNDHIGEIEVKGDNVMIGYYKDSVATAASFTEDGWLKTGDLGYIDDNGYIYIKGRSKTMLLGPSGENIYPEGIETKLASLPLVADCIITQNKKNKLVAYVYPDYPRMKAVKISDDKLIEIMELNRQKLNRITAKYENVSVLHIVSEPFPKTPKNTIKRYGLDALFSKYEK